MTVDGSTFMYQPSTTMATTTSNGNTSSGATLALAAAAKMVEHHLRLDSAYPQLVDLLKVGGVVPSVSGLNDSDYPGLSTSLSSLDQLSLSLKLPLPAELVEQFGHMQSNCQMGLFPELSRAWVTIDNDIYVWHYEDGRDLAYFDGLNETILGVGLIHPKPGIFKYHVNYLMCLTTPVEIVILGVSMVKRQEGQDVQEEMSLLPEPLFSIPSDNTFMITVKGTKDGRIFLGGKDGCLYEIAYQEKDSWLRRRCQKINHSSSYLSFFVPSLFNFAFTEDDAIMQIEVDDSRHILYTRSDKGNIQVFDLGATGNQMTKVAGLTRASIQQQAQQLARTIDSSHFKLVISICAVEVAESIHINLVAVTTSGIRLYFTCSSLKSPDLRPSTLQLVHVRLPPGFSANSAPQKPHQVHLALYSKGNLLLASAQGEESDLLWAMGNDAFPFRNQLIELHTTMVIDGHSWALAEALPPPGIPRSVCSLPLNKVLVPSWPPMVVSQHIEPPRRFVFLSTQGVHIVSKLRPVDQLRKLLIDNNGPDSEAVKAFFSLHKEAQACATCLILACSSVPQDKMVAEWATRAFLMYGGEPRLGYQTGLQPSSSPSTTILHPTAGPPSSPLSSGGMNIPASTPVPTAFSTYQGGPIISTPVSSPYQGFQTLPFSPVSPSQTVSVSPNTPYLPGGMGQGGRMDVLYSGRHNGLYLYLSRILRPIWNVKVVEPYTPNKVEVFKSNLAPDELAQYLEMLKALLLFVETNSRISPATNSFTPINPASMNIGAPHSPLSFMHPDATFVPQTPAPVVPGRQYQAEAEMQERASLLNLRDFIKHVCEVLGLWKILCEHQLYQLIMLLNSDLQTQLKSLLVKDLILSGKEISGALASALINRYLDDQASTDAISNRLQEVCPSIYRHEDAIFSKANEKLVQAKSTSNKAEKEILLNEALQLCKQISGTGLPLATVCGLFQEARFYTGLVELCEAAAQKRDPCQVALHFYHAGEPHEDTQGFRAFLTRGECYKCVTDALNYLLSASMSHPHAPRVPRSPGPPSPQDPTILSPEDAKNYADEMLQLAFQSKDELFHVALFGWMIESQHTEMLLMVKSPFLQAYLQRCSQRHPESLTTLDLLRQYYEKNHNYTAAARILAKLAHRPGSDINLEQRLEYLAHAIVCLKSNTLSLTSASDGEFLHELEEKMEVARIQMKILKALEHKLAQRPFDSSILAELNNNLLDITQLYEKFADPYNLAEAKLAIVHCAEHYDPNLVESLWQDIIAAELAASEGSSPQTRQDLLASKVTSLAATYANSRKFFPLTFLVKTLELKTCGLGMEPGWVVSALSSAATLPQLVETYHRLYQAKDPCWLAAHRPHHLLAVLATLFNKFLKEEARYPHQERLRLINKFQDQVASYLVDLQSSTSQSVAEDRALIQTFKGLQAQLERLLL